MELRGLTIPWPKYKAKNISRKERDLQKRLSDLNELISSISSASGFDSPRANYLEAEHNQLKQELFLTNQNREKAQLFCSKTRGIEQGEKPANYRPSFIRRKKCNAHLEEVNHQVRRTNLLGNTWVEMAHSRWRDAITLTPKEGSDTLANWHPITLNGKDLQIDQTPLKTVFSRGKSACKDKKLGEFYFKLLHRIEVTKSLLSRTMNPDGLNIREETF